MTRWLRSCAATALLVLLLVGVPLFTWRVVGWPLPTEAPSWDEVSRRVQQGDVPASTVLRLLAVVVWITWAQLAWSVVWELTVNLRRDVAGRPTRPPPLVIRPIGDAAARLLSVILAVGAIAGSPPVVALAAPAASAPVEPIAVPVAVSMPVAPGAAALPATGSASDSAKLWRADRFDSMWSIAERALGDGSTVDQLLGMNPSLSVTHAFRGGEHVRLPEHADVPADRQVSMPSSTYEVQPGDGMWDVAEALLGDGTRYTELARMVVGQEVAPGVVFWSTDQVLQPGWVFTVPTVPSSEGAVVVRRGDSLWSIAADSLGDARRWPELWEANRDEVMDDGRTFDDPDLILPGWTIDLPGHAEDDSVPAVDDGPDPTVVDPDPADGGDGAGDDDIDADRPVADPTGSAKPAGDTTPREVGDPETDAVPRPVNVWESADTDATGLDGSAASAHDGGEVGRPSTGDAGDEASVSLLTFERAAMLSAGILALLGVRRRDRLRRSRPRATIVERSPRAVGTERSLRAVDVGERFARVDVAIRAAALQLVECGERVVAVTVAPDGEVLVTCSGPVELPLPWSGTGASWRLPAVTPLELLAPEARRSGAPCPTLVQLGSTADGHDVYVDLEAVDAIEVGGPAESAAAIVTAVATTLAASVMAEVTSLVTVGVPSPAVLGHRHHVEADDPSIALTEAVAAVGSTRSQRRSTFELRALGTSGEAWEPAVVLIGSTDTEVRLPADRRALAVVSASPIHGPSSRLAPVAGSSVGEWELLPVGLRFVPIGLTAADAAALAELVDVPDAHHGDVADDPALARVLDHVDCVAAVGPLADDVACAADDGEPDGAAVGAPPLEWELLVTLFGSVSVVDPGGARVAFERSKTRELIAWLVTHRHRSTRSSARTALWEMDVRDATFANVVSEARRAMARLVEPPDGEEWIDRTLNDDLPLHELVRSDADVVEHALAAARVQPPAQAIATLRPAVDLVDGMPFAGTSYLWPDAEGITSQLVLLATTAASELAAHCLSVGDVEGVFAATARGLQVLPGHEELIGLRMRAHARAGDHAGVRAEWESYERVLVADPWSDGEPAPKLVDLRRSLLNP